MGLLSAKATYLQASINVLQRNKIWKLLNSSPSSVQSYNSPKESKALLCSMKASNQLTTLQLMEPI